MKRREFITLLGGAAAAWPLAAHAQQASKLPTIGFLGGSTASTQSEWTAAFVQRLRELGWIEGRTCSGGQSCDHDDPDRLWCQRRPGQARSGRPPRPAGRK